MYDRHESLRGLKLWIVLYAVLTLALAGGCSKPDPDKAPGAGAPVEQTSQAPPASEVGSPDPAPSPAAAANPPQTETASTAGEPEPEDDDEATTGARLILSGRVTFGSDGQPAGNAKVLLQSNEWTADRGLVSNQAGQTTTDAKGHYRLSVPDSMMFVFQAFHPDAATFTEVLVNHSGVEPAGGLRGTRRVTFDIVLPKGAILSGRVLTPDDKPVAGASIQAQTIAILKSEGRQAPKIFVASADTTSDDEGKFTIRNIPVGETLLIAGAEGFVASETAVTAPKEEVVLRLDSQGASIDGVVYMKTTGAGTPGAEVTLMQKLERMKIRLGMKPKTVKTDAGGAFQFEKLPAGEYVLSVKKDPLVQYSTPESSQEGFALATGEKKEHVALFLYEGHTVRGRVTDRQTGAPLEGVVVSQFQGGPVVPSRSSTTDPDGEYILTGFAAGSHVMLQVEKKGYKRAPTSRHANPYEMVQVPTEGTEVTRDIEMVPMIAVSGRVVTESGTGIPGAKVSLFSQDHSSRMLSVTTEADGSYEIEAMPFTTLRAKVTADGYPFATSELVTLLDDSVSNVDIVMKRGATVTGKVLDPDGKPVWEAEVSSYLVIETVNSLYRESAGSTKTDAAGGFMLSNVPEGSATFLAKKEGFAESRREEVLLKSGESRFDVLLKLRTTHFIAGRVTDGEGEPIENCRIFAHSQAGGGHCEAQTDADGRYRLDGLADDLYYVSASHEKDNEHKQAVAVDRDDVDFVLGDPSNKVTLIGRVVDAKTGNPLSDYQVQDIGSGVKKDPAVPGRFTVEGLLGGVGYSISVTAPGYRSWSDVQYLHIPKGIETFNYTFKLGTGGTILGRVVTREGDRPLGGVKVVVLMPVNEWEARSNPPAATAVTDADGLFLFEKLSAGQTTVDFHPPAPLARTSKTIKVGHEETTDLGDVAMKGGSTIRGRVLRGLGDTPVPNVEVVLRPQSTMGGDEKKAITDATGAFAFADLAPGHCSLRVPGEAIQQHLNVEAEKDHDIVIRIGSAVFKGRVIRNGKGTVAVLTISDRKGSGYAQTQSDGDGSFLITGLSGSTYWVGIQQQGDWQNRIEEQVELVDGKTFEKDFLFPSGRISGRVLDGLGKPVVDATVRARSIETPTAVGYNPHTETQSDGKGEFAFTSLKAGTYTLTASKADLGLAKVEGIALADSGEVKGIELRLDLNNGGTIVSVVLNMEGNPIPDAWCFLSSPGAGRIDHGISRGGDGVMKIVGVPPGTYQMEVSYWSHSVATRTIEVKDGESRTYEDVLYAAGALRWTLKDKAGEPLREVPCTLTPNDATSIEEPREGRTAVAGPDEGQFVVRGLFPGEYTAVATLPDGRTLREVVVIAERDLTQVTTIAE